MQALNFVVQNCTPSPQVGAPSHLGYRYLPDRRPHLTSPTCLCVAALSQAQVAVDRVSGEVVPQRRWIWRQCVLAGGPLRVAGGWPCCLKLRTLLNTGMKVSEFAGYLAFLWPSERWGCLVFSASPCVTLFLHILLFQIRIILRYEVIIQIYYLFQLVTQPYSLNC